MSDPKQPLIPPTPPPPYPSAPPPPAYAPVSSSHTTVIATPPVITATTVMIRPRTYMVWSVISIFWLCPILGIFALMYSLKVDSEWAAGHHAEAYAASRMARNLNLISFFCHTAVWVVFVIIIVSVSVA